MANLTIITKHPEKIYSNLSPRSIENSSKIKGKRKNLSKIPNNKLLKATVRFKIVSYFFIMLFFHF